MILSGNVTTKMRTRNLMRNFSNHLQETLLFLIILMSLSETIPNRSKRGLPENPITNCSYLRKFLRNNKIIKQMLPLQVDDTNRNISNTTSITHDQINNMAITKRPNLTVNTRDCQKQKRVVFCHTYINNMYGFYTTIGGFVMLAVVATGITFLIVTHFHGRYIVKTNQHVVEKIAKWDAIQHRKQQARERNNVWL